MKRAHLVAFSALAVLYLWGLAPSVHVHDAGELTAGAWTLGIAHPPGAPLYMLVCKFFTTVIPFGHIAWRANLLSAVLALATCSLLVFWAHKRSGSTCTALATGAFAALAPVFWSQALMAEVYTLQALLLVSAIASFDLGWRPEISAFLWGLLLACHVGLAPLTPVFLVLALYPAAGTRLGAAPVIKAMAAVALPLLLYLYLPLRSLADPPLDWGDPETLERLWWHLSNRNVRGRMFSLEWTVYLARAVDYARILGANLLLGIPAVFLTVLTVARRSRTALFCALVVVYDSAFVVLLDTAPLESEAYGIPAVVAAAMLLTFAIQYLQRWQLDRAAAAVVIVATFLSAAFAAPGIMLNRSFVVRDTVEAVLDQVPRGAVLLTQEDNTTFALAYLVAAEGARPDLKIYDRAGNLFTSPYDRPLFTVDGDLAAYRQQQEEPFVATLLRNGREVWYATPFVEFHPSAWHIEPRGTVGRAGLDSGRERSAAKALPPLPRRPTHPDWMSRQVLAMDRVRRAAALSEDAPAHLESALDLADIAELKLRIGQLALQVGRTDLASRSAAEACDIKPDLAPAWSLRAHSELLAGNPDSAEGFARQAIELAPDLPQPFSTLALIAIEQQNWETADQALGTALLLGASGPEPLVNRALVRKRLGLLDLAIADLEEASSHEPLCGDICLRRLELIVEAGATRHSLRDEVCRALQLGLPLPISPQHLTRFLTVAARAGYPACVRDWVAAINDPEDHTALILDAYRRAQHR